MIGSRLAGRTRGPGALLLALGLLVGSPVWAAADVDEPQLVTQGIELRKQGKDEAAFEVFENAWERFRTPRSRAHLGLTAQALGRWALAETHLAAALTAEGDDWITGKRKTLEDALAVVRKHVGSLEVLGDVPDAEVLVDGQSLGKLPLEAPLRLAAGTVVVQVQSPGYIPVQRPVTVTGGLLTRERFQLVRVSLPPAAPAMASEASSPSSILTDRAGPPPPGPDRRRRYILFAGIGAAGLGVALTTWSGMSTLSARDRYVANPTEQGYRDGVGMQRRTNALAISTVLLAAGAVTWGLLTNWGAR